MDNKRLSFIMGERLRHLREAKGLSHARLGEELYKKYNDSNESKQECQRRNRSKDKCSQTLISEASLKNYEVTEETHSKAYKNEGINAEYLRYLADFYGVSVDYILGLSDVPSPNAETRAICEKTGLSEKTVSKLFELQAHEWTYISCFLDYIVAYPELEKLILAIHQKNESEKMLRSAIVKGAGNDFEVSLSAVYQTYIEREFQEMIKGFNLNIEEANNAEK